MECGRGDSRIALSTFFCRWSKIMPYYSRKNPRLSGYNYNDNGVYFLTLCTHERKPLFSQIYGDNNEQYPENRLSEYGKIMETVIRSIPERFSVTLENFVIMPNHVHILIEIHDTQQLRAIHESPLRSRSLISKVVGYLKMNTSKQIHQLGYSGEIWQRSFHDHIVRSKKDYDKIWMYIEDNPRRWNEDCFFCEFDKARTIQELP